VALIGIVYGLYSLGRLLAAQHTGAAFAHADQVWRLERWLHLPDEQRLQETVLGWPHVIDAANSYYRDVHFTLTFALLAWLCWFREETYGWIRNTLIASTVAALALHFAYPLAPPRMLGGLGFVDTGAANSISNHYAAMPSLHVGWALLVAIGMVAANRSRWRWFFVLHPIATMLVVVVTANHYWVDGLVGMAIVVAGVLVFRPKRRTEAVQS
jgi:hypothetical protein